MRRWPLASQEKFSPEPDHANDTMISDFQPPELEKINFCRLCHPVYGILLYQYELGNRPFLFIILLWPFQLVIKNRDSLRLGQESV